MTRQLKVGVVGGGVGRGHIRAYQELPDLFEVTAFCDIDESRASAICDEHAIGQPVHRLEDLFDLDLDLIDICTPSNLHASQAQQVLEAGVNTVVEKPLAASLSEADALAEAERKSAGKLFPIFQYRFGNGIGRLHHLVDAGLAGAPSVATAETHWRREADYYAAGPWRGKWAGELGGTLATHAIHIHDLLMQVLGPLKTVYARADNRVNGNETEDMAVLALGFANGSLATSSITLGAHPQTSRLRFCFEGLTAESGLDPYNPGHDPWTFSHAEPEGQARIYETLAAYEPKLERFVGQFASVHASITAGAPPPVTVADSRASIELLTAAYWSILTGETVNVPIGSDHPFYGGWIERMKKDFTDGRA